MIDPKGVEIHPSDQDAIDHRVRQLNAYGWPVFSQRRSKHEDEHDDRAGLERMSSLQPKQDGCTNKRFEDRENVSEVKHTPRCQRRLRE